MSNNYEIAIGYFKRGSNCAQSILATYFPILELDDNFGHKIGSGLGAGLSRKQYLCGVLNAGAIILSIYFGNEYPDQIDKKELTYKEVNDMVNCFESELKSSQCKDILGVKIDTEEGRKKAAELNLFATKCVLCMKKVCEILDSKLVP